MSRGERAEESSGGNHPSQDDPFPFTTQRKNQSNNNLVTVKTVYVVL
jgi:hypothetical protein